MFRLILGIQMIEVAVELIEAMYCRQEFVLVPKMVLAELSSRVPLRFQKLGYSRLFSGQSFLCSRKADLREAGPQWTLSGDKRRASRRAGLLPVIVGEDRAFVGDAINVGRAISHHAAVVGADVPVTDVIGRDDENVGLLQLLGRRWCACGCRERSESEEPPPNTFLLGSSVRRLLPKNLVSSRGPARIDGSRRIGR